MKCRWCDHEFKRGGPYKAWFMLEDHVERDHPEHRDEARRALEAVRAAEEGDLDCHLLANMGRLCDLEDGRRA